MLSDKTCEDIVRAAGCVTDQDPYRSIRKVLSPGGSKSCRQRAAGGKELKKLSTMKIHA
jgi:hypothetical protein